MINEDKLIIFSEELAIFFIMAYHIARKKMKFSILAIFRSHIDLQFNAYYISNLLSFMLVYFPPFLRNKNTYLDRNSCH